jgi:hypothetical protein
MRKTVLSFFLLALLGCKAPPEDPEIVVTAPPEFSVDLYEQRDPDTGEATFGLWIQSLRTYPCDAPQVVAEAGITNGKVLIRILGVEATGCVTGEAIAKRFLPIGTLADNTYDFSIQIGPLNTDGSLRVASGKYELTLPDPKGIEIQEYVLNSIPDGLFWGTVQIPNAAAQNKASLCVAALKNASSDPGLAPGFYGYFTLSATGQTAPHRSIAGSGPEQFFLRKRSNSLDPIRAILETYRNDQDAPLQLRCFSTEGEL